MRTIIALALGAAIAIFPALAEPETNIAGQWTFTANISPNCSFGGTASLQHQGDGKYTGELTARQSCTTLEEDYLVRQDCKARVFGRQVSVRCRIVEFINGFDSASYYPDNFTLTIASPDRMHGALRSAGNASPAEWKRAEGGIS